MIKPRFYQICKQAYSRCGRRCQLLLPRKCFFSIRFWCREWRQKILTACDLNLYCILYLYLNIYVERHYEQIWSPTWYPLPNSSSQNNKDISSKQRKRIQKTKKTKKHRQKPTRITLLLALRRQRRRQLKLEVVDVHRWVSQPKKLHQFEIQLTERTSEVLILEVLWNTVHCAYLDQVFRGTTEAEVATRVTVALFMAKVMKSGHCRPTLQSEIPEKKLSDCPPSDSCFQWDGRMKQFAFHPIGILM